MKKTMQKGFTLIELMIVVAIIAILAAIAIPQYQTYVIRSQVTRVMGEAGDLKTAVEDCLNSNASPTWGSGSCVNTGTSSDLIDGGIPNVTLAADESKIEATFGNHANAKLVSGGGKLTWTRNSSGSWTCTTQSIDAKYVPGSCPNG